MKTHNLKQKQSWMNLIVLSVLCFSLIVPHSYASLVETHPGFKRDLLDGEKGDNKLKALNIFKEEALLKPLDEDKVEASDYLDHLGKTLDTKDGSLNFIQKYRSTEGDIKSNPLMFTQALAAVVFTKKGDIYKDENLSDEDKKKNFRAKLAEIKKWLTNDDAMKLYGDKDDQKNWKALVDVLMEKFEGMTPDELAKLSSDPEALVAFLKSEEVADILEDMGIKTGTDVATNDDDGNQDKPDDDKEDQVKKIREQLEQEKAAQIAAAEKRARDAEAAAQRAQEEANRRNFTPTIQPPQVATGEIDSLALESLFQQALQEEQLCRAEIERNNDALGDALANIDNAIAAAARGIQPLREGIQNGNLNDVLAGLADQEDDNDENFGQNQQQPFQAPLNQDRNDDDNDLESDDLASSLLNQPPLAQIPPQPQVVPAVPLEINELSELEKPKALKVADGKLGQLESVVSTTKKIENGTNGFQHNLDPATGLPIAPLSEGSSGLMSLYGGPMGAAVNPLLGSINPMLGLAGMAGSAYGQFFYQQKIQDQMQNAITGSSVSQQELNTLNSEKERVEKVSAELRQELQTLKDQEILAQLQKQNPRAFRKLKELEEQEKQVQAEIQQAQAASQDPANALTDMSAVIATRTADLERIKSQQEDIESQVSLASSESEARIKELKRTYDAWLEAGKKIDETIGKVGQRKKVYDDQLVQAEQAFVAMSTPPQPEQNSVLGIQGNITINGPDAGNATLGTAVQPTAPVSPTAPIEESTSGGERGSFQIGGAN